MSDIRPPSLAGPSRRGDSARAGSPPERPRGRFASAPTQLRERAEQLRSWRPWKRGRQVDTVDDSEIIEDSLENFLSCGGSGSLWRVGEVSWSDVAGAAQEGGEEGWWAAAGQLLAARGLESDGRPPPPAVSPVAQSEVPAGARSATSAIDAAAADIAADLDGTGRVAAATAHAFALACCACPVGVAADVISNVRRELLGKVSMKQGDDGMAAKVSQLRHQSRKSVLVATGYGWGRFDDLLEAASPAGAAPADTSELRSVNESMREVSQRAAALALHAVDEAFEQAMMPTDEWGFLISDWDLQQRVAEQIGRWPQPSFSPPYRDADPVAVARSGFGTSRRAAWAELSGATDAIRANEGLYESLPAQADAQVLRDVARTFQSNKSYAASEGDGRVRLTRLLSRYGAHYEHGYCQAMSFIAATLLLVMPEEEAFWVLDAIVQSPTYSKDYYTHGARGGLQQAMADMRVLDGVVFARMPELEHDMQIPPSLVCFQWFMVLFIGCVPVRYAFHIIDAYLLIGQTFLFEFAYGIMRRHAEMVAGADGHDAAAKLKALLRSDSELLYVIANAAKPGMSRGQLDLLRCMPAHFHSLRSDEQVGRRDCMFEEQAARRRVAASAGACVGVTSAMPFGDLRRVLECNGARVSLAVPAGTVLPPEIAAALRRLSIPVLPMLVRPAPAGTVPAGPAEAADVTESESGRD